MTPSSGEVRIEVAPRSFSDWTAVLELLHATYAYMESRIDPPSSLLRMDAARLEARARDESLILAFADQRLVGCAFASTRERCVYVGKLAVDVEFRRRGVARRILSAAAALARANGRPSLELETRIELTENHATFAAIGFVRVGESSHPGYDRPTIVRMRRPVTPYDVCPSRRPPAGEP